MRLFAFAPQLILASVVLAAAPAVRAQAPSVTEQPKIEAPESPEAAKTEPEAVTIDTLFADLRRESDPTKARRISAAIVSRWTDSGSATANLLMQWSQKAISEKRTVRPVTRRSPAVTLGTRRFMSRLPDHGSCRCLRRRGRRRDRWR